MSQIGSTLTAGTSGVASVTAGTGINLTGTASNPIINLTVPVAIANGGTNATSFSTVDGTVYYDGTRLVTTATGTSGQVLTSGGAGVAPSYTTIISGVASVTAGTGISLTGTGANPIINLTVPVAIANGGTNATSMATTDGTVYFDGTRLVTTATGTSGWVLTSAGAGVAPAYAVLPTSVASITAGTGISVTGTATVPIVSLTVPVAIANGGTNATSMATTDGTVYYDGTRLVTTATGTTGQMLTSNGAGVAPTYQNGVTSITAGTGISVTGTALVPIVGLTVPVAIANGGTNATSMATTDGTVYYDGTRLVTTATGTAGWVLTSGGAGVAPAYAVLPASSSFTWTVTTANASIVAANGYIANKAGLLTMTLPASGSIGDLFEITGINTAVGWRVAQNASQQIFFGTSSTTVGTGGYLEATNIRDSIRCVCVVSGSSTVWNVISSIGNITVN